MGGPFQSRSDIERLEQRFELPETRAAAVPVGPRGPAGLTKVTERPVSYLDQSETVQARLSRMKRRNVVLRVENLDIFLQAARPRSQPFTTSRFRRIAGIFCIIGSSGCGKSALIRILAVLETHSAGEVLLDDRPIDGPERERGMGRDKDSNPGHVSRTHAFPACAFVRKKWCCQSNRYKSLISKIRLKCQLTPQRAPTRPWQPIFGLCSRCG